jgi:hypothetical protein
MTGKKVPQIILPPDNRLYSVFDQALYSQTKKIDPCQWVNEKLGVDLYSNQMEVIEAISDPSISDINVLQCRGAGKSLGVSWGLIELAINQPGTKFVIAGPIQNQAKRIIRYVKETMLSGSSKLKDKLDQNESSVLRLPFKNGSCVNGVSGQEKAEVEGEHGSILVLDEAHRVSGYSLSNKLQPMITPRNGRRKIIKIGQAIGRGHFYKSCMAKGAKTITCRWDQAEIYLADETDPWFYHGKQYSRLLLSYMPLKFRVKMFPDVPWLHTATGAEILELDWLTQYAMEWIADINNFLSDEDQDTLASGKHKPLTQGRAGDLYFGGLDTASSDRITADNTELVIWRLCRDGSLEKVASFIWHGKVLEQESEIWQILNPKNGLFKCEAVLGDNSNIAISMIQRFLQAGLPIVGVSFGGSAKSVGSNKNWKNTLFDHFLLRLETGELAYPDIKQMELDSANANRELRIQIDNLLDDFTQWTYLQRIRGKGLNDVIEAPHDKQQTDDGNTDTIHDDGCAADVMAVWAARHRDQMRKEIMAQASGGGMFFDIPVPVIGGPSFQRSGVSENPYRQAELNKGSQAPWPAQAPTSSNDDDPFTRNQGGTLNIDGMIGANRKRR